MLRQKTLEVIEASRAIVDNMNCTTPEALRLRDNLDDKLKAYDLEVQIEETYAKRADARP